MSSCDGLEPCPFCGRTSHLGVEEVDAIEVKEGDRPIGELPTFAVGCSFCGALGPESLSEREAREGWNRREGGHDA